MRKHTPPDWVLIEAAKRCDWQEGKTRAQLRGYLAVSGAFSALCDMILKHEQPPVDRKLLCVSEAITQSYDQEFRSNICQWQWIAVRAIELWEEGFGA